MSRVPYIDSDKKKLPNIGNHLFHGLNDFTPGNADRTRELVVQLTDYANMHEWRACAVKTISELKGSFTRADIRLSFAKGLNTKWGVQLLEAFLRAGRAKLPSLAIDQLTVQRKREEQSQTLEAGVEFRQPTKGMAAQHEWHDEQLRLLELGAPSYDLAVWSTGAAFHWPSFIELYDAICNSKFADALVDPKGLFAPGSREAMDKFLREVLIPQSRIPVAQLVRSGLKVPHHEVVWLFTEEGRCMGKAIRHTAHGGFLPRLFVNQDEVFEGLALVLCGAHPQFGSSKIPAGFGKRRADQPVFTLKAGAPEPQVAGSSHDFSTAIVSVEELERVPNLGAGSYTISKPFLKIKETAWFLDGKIVQATKVRTQSMGMTYFETVPWLNEGDLPLLFPDYRPAVVEESKDPWPLPTFREVANYVFLPPSALNLQERGQSILDRKARNAKSWLSQGAVAGVLANRCRAAIDPSELESKVADLRLRFEGVSVVDLSVKRSLMVSERLTTRFPELSRYGAFTLNTATLLACEGRPFTSFYLETVELVEVLKGIVMLESHHKSSTPIRVFRPQSVDVAVNDWFEDRGAVELVQRVAESYDAYYEALNLQQQRILAITAALDADEDCRKEARDHRYVYVGKEVLRAKPREDLALAKL